MNLLSVDWDYFFPNPNDTDPIGEEWPLYDWGSVESLPYITMLWEGRATAFVRNGLELPMAQGWEQFWNRFRFRRGTKLYVSESHSAIVGLLSEFKGKKNSEVFNFDAHHDAGYRQETLKQINAKLKIGRVSCEDWVWWFIANRIDVRTIYPAWKSLKAEKPPAWPILRTNDDGEPIETNFGAVFLCRSGAWMPSWTDDQFGEFVNSFPGPVAYLEPKPLERTFSMEEVERETTMLEELANRQETR